MKNLCFLIPLLILFNCCNKKQGSSLNINTIDSCDSEIKSIEILYFNFEFNSAESIHWEDVKLNIPNFIDEYHGVLNARITNCEVLKKLEKELMSLHPKKKQHHGADARIVLTINYKKKKPLILGIGGTFTEEVFSSEEIKLETKNTNRLLFLIKNNIGYYPWINQVDKDYMKELKDTSAAKEPIMESPYYKQYLKMVKKKK